MIKKPITRSDLKVRALSEIRGHPQCDGVMEVAITRVNVSGSLPTGHINIVDEGSADIERAHIAARDVQAELDQIYELID